ncbi:MAG TPA: hypothetical protein VM677_01385 [Actinokineospora sp.]|nr:hypothetical protein [Actinokineospora sp.]
MTGRSGGAKIRLHDIRAHEGSQARAWEELAYQLRPPVGDGHIETRKTRAPDAGVEWYEVYADGHHEGFQAKFHPSLADALGGMRESVEAVCAKRPELTKLTFVVPYDFTDSGASGTKTDQDRWNDAVTRWRTDFPVARGIEFTTIRAGDITATLSLKEHAGRREYWFGGLEITDDWLKYRFAESVQVAGGRYTPEADSPSAINSILDAAVVGPSFVARFRALATRAIGAVMQDTGMWGVSTAVAAPLIEQLHGACAMFLKDEDIDDDVLPQLVPDLGNIAELTRKLSERAYAEWENLPSYGRRNLDSAISALEALYSLATGTAAMVVAGRSFALVGPAGQGKTHALMRAVDGCLRRGAPAIAILGQRLSDKNWWPAVAETLGGITVSSDEFLQALDSLAEASRCRALVVIDAINESQWPKRWRDELPAMLAQVQRYPNLVLVVSYRTDYRDVIGASSSLIEIHHPGLAGKEAEALAAYCKLFSIPVPSKGLFQPALSSPLFLRMYCEVIAADPHGGVDAPTRSDLFTRYADVIGRKVASKLDLAPSTTTVSDALTRVAERILDNDGRPVARALIEEDVDSFLPGRTWPDTLFQRLASEGLIELRPTYDGTESVGFPFQAYSEHLLADRLLASVDRASKSWTRRIIPLSQKVKRRRILAKRIASAPWSWRSLAVVLPGREGIELIDLLPSATQDFRLQEAMRESLTDRSAADFGAHALNMLRTGLSANPDDDSRGLEAVLSLAPREAHPGNADWLHAQLLQQAMPDRDATWSIATFNVDQNSDAYRRLTRWAERFTNTVGDEEARLASTLLMWLLTSPNRFLRDGASKTLVTLLSKHLAVASSLVRSAMETDDPYIQERALTCCYGAVLSGGDHDLESVRLLLKVLSDWQEAGLPIDVIARDSGRGIAAWCVDRGLVSQGDVHSFAPPYGSEPPMEPPTREELKAAHGPIKDADGNYTAWRASSILRSCLDWYGDFNKYVVKSDVEFFSWHPLCDPAPTGKDHKNPLDEIDVSWAGRWIADRAISLGWTTDRFESFERNSNTRDGREGHKVERFGKKYQWIAHRELLARLADNFHPSYETWSTTQNTYHGPWVWYGRDFDPTLPPSLVDGESQVCHVARDTEATWATLRSPEMDNSATPSEWVAKIDDLPEATPMFSCADPDGRTWVAIQRYSTWDRDNAQRTGMSKRERDVFFLQFSWLVPRGQGVKLYEFIEVEGLSGRWMPETRRMHHQYLGETASAPIVATAESVLYVHDIPKKLRSAGIRPRPAVEHYLWEGNTLDCSIDESVDFYTPTPELLGTARWVGHRAEWAVDGTVIARAIEVPSAEKSQDMLVVDAEWLTNRLRELDTDMVIGTLSERHALPLDDDDFRRMAFSDIWYVALVTSGQKIRESGPHLKIRRQIDHDQELQEPTDGVQDEQSDPSS